MAKKIMALVAAMALVVCFAVSASAGVVTTTTYVDGEADVTVKVTEIAADTNVTYYATKGSTPVFVDQKVAGANGVEFNFVTPYTNVGSNVVIGYTNVEDPADVDPIPAAQYTITYEGAVVGSANHGAGTPITIANPAGEFEVVTDVKATNATASYEFVGNNIEVTLSNVVGNVVITVEKAEIEIPNYEGTIDIAESAAIVVKADDKGKIKNDLVIDENGAEVNDERVNAAEGNRKLTVCGKISNDFTEYGIIVSATPITGGKMRPADFAAYADMKYVAGTKDADGKFAVQIIDTSDNGAIVAANQAYHTAVYAYSEANQAYYVAVYANTVTAAN